MKRILITGSSGLLGRPLYQMCRTQPDWQVAGTALTRVRDDRVKLDLLNLSEVSDFLEEFNPQVIMHAAAERHPDICEEHPDMAASLNIDATRHLAEQAHKCNAWMIYFSTDYVFDGTHPPYSPESVPNPVNVYARSKWRGEQEVQAACPDGLVLRISSLYGPSESLDEGPVTSILSDLYRAQSEAVHLDDWALRYPTYTLEVVEILRQLMLRCIDEDRLSGIYHWSGKDRMTRYEMGRQVADIFGLSADRIQALPGPPSGASRPKDVRLDCSGLEAYELVQRVSFSEAIRRTLEPFVKRGS